MKKRTAAQEVTCKPRIMGTKPSRCLFDVKLPYRPHWGCDYGNPIPQSKWPMPLNTKVYYIAEYEPKAIRIAYLAWFNSDPSAIKFRVAFDSVDPSGTAFFNYENAVAVFPFTKTGYKQALRALADHFDSEMVMNERQIKQLRALIDEKAVLIAALLDKANSL